MKSPSDASDMFSRTDMIWIVPSALRSSGISAIPRAIRPATSFASSGSPSRKKRPVACGCCAMMTSKSSVRPAPISP